MLFSPEFGKYSHRCLRFHRLLLADHIVDSEEIRCSNAHDLAFIIEHLVDSGSFRVVSNAAGSWFIVVIFPVVVYCL